MKVFLDENFPLPLYHRLRGLGVDVEHVIVLGQRGVQVYRFLGIGAARNAQ